MTSANVSMAMNMLNINNSSKPTDKGAGEGEASFMSTFSKSMELTSANQSEASPRMGVTARTVVRVSDNRQSLDSEVKEQPEMTADASSANTKADENVEPDSKSADTKEVSAEKEATAVNVKSEVKSEELTEEEVTDMAEAVSEIIANIVEILQETLNVEPEKITDAMDALGMDITELTSFSAAKNLFLTLSSDTAMDEEKLGTVDTDLLFSEEFSNFSEQITELLIDFNRENGMSLASAADVLEQTPDFDFKEFASEVTSMISLEMNEELMEEDTVGPVEIGEAARKSQTVDSKPAIELLDEDSSEVFVKTEEMTKPENSSNENKGQEFERDSKKNDGPALVNNNQQVNESIAFADRTSFGEAITEVTTPSGEVVEVPHIIEQIVQRASIMQSNGETTMEMILNPEGLGRIYMQVSQKGDEVTARLMTENSAVKEALEASLAEVKEKLELSGTKVNDIEVSVGTHGFERNLEQGQERQQQEGAYQEELRSSTRRSLHIDALDNLMGLMSEEEELAARIMKDNGGTLDYQA